MADYAFKESNEALEENEEVLKDAKKVGTIQFDFKRMVNSRYEVDVIFREKTEPVYEITTIMLTKPQLDALIKAFDTPSVSSCLQLHYPVFDADSIKLNTGEKLIYFGKHHLVSFTCVIGGSEIVAPVGAFDFLSKSDIYIDFPPGDDDEPEQG